MTKIEELKEILKITNLEEIGYTLPADIIRESGASRAIRDINYRKNELEACGTDEYKLEEFALKYFLKWKTKNQAIARSLAMLDEGSMSDWCELVGCASEEKEVVLNGVQDCPLTLAHLKRAKKLASFRGLREPLLDVEISKKEV